MIIKKQFTAQLSNNNRRSPFWVKDGGAGEASLGEKALAVFQPDVLVSEQYLATYRRKFHLNPERLLMLAVLEDAIVCFQDNIGATCQRKRALYRDAEQWILDTDSSYLFSFNSVCDMLDYEASYLRQGLTRWRDAVLAGLAEKKPARVGPKRQSFKLMAEARSDRL